MEGADASILTEGRSTPLHYFCRNDLYQGVHRQDVLKYLEGHDSKQFTINSSHNNNAFFQRFFGRFRDNIDGGLPQRVLKLMQQRGLDIDARNAKGNYFSF
jgi:hypothetical protein